MTSAQSYRLLVIISVLAAALLIYSTTQLSAPLL